MVSVKTKGKICPHFASRARGSSKARSQTALPPTCRPACGVVMPRLCNTRATQNCVLKSSFSRAAEHYCLQYKIFNAVAFPAFFWPLVVICSHVSKVFILFHYSVRLQNCFSLLRFFCFAGICQELLWKIHLSQIVCFNESFSLVD